MANNNIAGRHIGTIEVEVPAFSAEKLNENFRETLKGLANRLMSPIEDYDEMGPILAITETKGAHGGSLTGCCFLQDEAECFEEFPGHHEEIIYIDENGDFASLSQDVNTVSKTIYRKKAKWTSNRMFAKLYEKINAGTATRKDIEKATESMGVKLSGRKLNSKA